MVIRRKSRIGLSAKVLMGMALGIATGVSFGEMVGFLKPVGDASVQLLQMSVLPFVLVSLIAGLGQLTYDAALSLAKECGLLLLVFWAISLVAVAVMPLAFPAWESASSFTPALVQECREFDLLQLCSPANPFFSLANAIIPAVVVFSIAMGAALIGAAHKGDEMTLKLQRHLNNIVGTAVLLACLASPSAYAKSVAISDAQVDNIVRRSYQYVAMYNVNQKFALNQGGYNTCDADAKLKDHTMREIARPNNDTLYIGCMLDLRKEPVILEMPAFDSKYVSLMVTGYDHYVNVPMTTRLGDFRKPEKMLFYTARTEGYKGESVKGVDRIFEASGDFISAVFRVMPHSHDPERFKRIVKQMQSVRLVTLSEYQGGKAKPIGDIQFPPVGKTDFDVFGNNLLEVMQFVFNHTTFDPNNEIDQGVLAVYKPLGIEPGKSYDPGAVKPIDGKRFRSMAEQVAAKNLALMGQPDFAAKLKPYWMEPKGMTNLDALVAASVIGPIGLPAEEAEYPPITTTDGKKLNAMHDYVIRMTKEQLPPAKAFWSVTLYDLQNGFFIPNDRKKYSVGDNAGMKLDKDGGIAIYIAAQKPKGVPEENWLPINRKDEDLSVNLRIYVPDPERMKTWNAPKAERIE